VIEDKNIMIASTRRDGKATGLIGVGFHDVVFFEEHAKNLMTRRGKDWVQIKIDRIRGRN
jgi:hypothetical protein